MFRSNLCCIHHPILLLKTSWKDPNENFSRIVAKLRPVHFSQYLRVFGARVMKDFHQEIWKIFVTHFFPWSYDSVLLSSLQLSSLDICMIWPVRSVGVQNSALTPNLTSSSGGFLKEPHFSWNVWGHDMIVVRSSSTPDRLQIQLVKLVVRGGGGGGFLQMKTFAVTHRGSRQWELFPV